MRLNLQLWREVKVFGWRLACALQDTIWRSSLGLKLNLLFFTKTETRDRGPISKDILIFCLDVIHKLIYSRAF